MSGYVLAAEADLDLQAIWAYIAEDKPEAADRWIAKLFDTFESLAKAPHIGHSRPDLTSLPLLFRPVSSYLVVYRLNQGQVQIVAVTQGSRDIPVFLDRRTQ